MDFASSSNSFNISSYFVTCLFKISAILHVIYAAEKLEPDTFLYVLLDHGKFKIPENARILTIEFFTNIYSQVFFKYEYHDTPITLSN